jgi:hypothetical protein
MTDATTPAASDLRPRRGSGWINVVLALALVVAVGGVAFAVGRSTAAPTVVASRGFGVPGASLAPDGSFTTGGPNGRPGGVAAGGPTVRGTVEAVDEDSVTVRLDSGVTVEITLDANTSYHSQAEANADDIATGSEVIVQLDGITGRPGPNASPSGPLGTAGDVTVVP